MPSLHLDIDLARAWPSLRSIVTGDATRMAPSANTGRIEEAARQIDLTKPANNPAMATSKAGAAASTQTPVNTVSRAADSSALLYL